MAQKPKKAIVFLGVTICILFAAFVLFFFVNRFSLHLNLAGEDQTVISAGDPYSEPDRETYLYGTLFFKNGIPVDADSAVRGDVNNRVPGTYELTYDASWCWLRVSEKRTVIVKDTQAPVISLEYISGACTLPGEDYVEEGFSAWDDCDGDVTAKVIRQVGEGIVTYTVSDQAGNQTSVSREICTYDAVAPNVVLTGGDTVYQYAGEDYTEPGWVAADNHDGDLSHRVTVAGTVDKYLAGNYELTYTVTDDSGNVTEVVRTVVVQPRERSEIVVPEGNVIYLTFDDGPSIYTPRLLEILEKYNAKATFFVMNTGCIDLVKDIVEGGHSVGIHSVNHKYKEIYASPEAYFNDILTMQQIIYDLTGVRTYLMRFPGGSSNTTSIFNPGIMTYLTQAVEDNGFCYFDWHVDSRDAAGAQSSEEVYRNMRAGAYDRQITIMLQHDTTAFSVTAVEKLLIWGIENGYQFLALDMTSPAYHHEVKN